MRKFRNGDLVTFKPAVCSLSYYGIPDDEIGIVIDVDNITSNAVYNISVKFPSRCHSMPLIDCDEVLLVKESTNVTITLK
jgi:hypothetical protein